MQLGHQTPCLAHTWSSVPGRTWMMLLNIIYTYTKSTLSVVELASCADWLAGWRAGWQASRHALTC
jgi:hypothetical protein